MRRVKNGEYLTGHASVSLEKFYKQVELHERFGSHPEIFISDGRHGKDNEHDSGSMVCVIGGFHNAVVKEDKDGVTYITFTGPGQDDITIGVQGTAVVQYAEATAPTAATNGGTPEGQADLDRMRSVAAARTIPITGADTAEPEPNPNTDPS
ncbi:MAG TPA: hypothetical protein VGN17_00510 [Bryobacteraceae bacterium]|jgi:hypothetical protein